MDSRSEPEPESVSGADTVADVAVFRCPKRGHSLTEYEDAAATSDADVFPLRVAVADGATESAFAQRWAQILATGWVKQAPCSPDAFAQAVSAWRRQWQQEADGEIQGQPWYAAAKAEQGAFAALLGLTLHSSGTWQAVGVGDCNLFHLRDGAVQLAWPVSDPAAFTHRPVLITSQPSQTDGTPDVMQGTWAAGDTFLLASDALAAWLLRIGPAAGRALDAASFEPRIRQARDEGVLRNDDVTLVRMCVRAA